MAGDVGGTSDALAVSPEVPRRPAGVEINAAVTGIHALVGEGAALRATVVQDQLGTGAVHGEVFEVKVLVVEQDQCERIGGSQRLGARLEADGVGCRGGAEGGGGRWEPKR